MKCKITTWNVNSLKVRKPHVLQFLQEESPDILCLQELKQPTEEVDIRAFAELSYSTEVFGQKTYNGVATLTKKAFFLNALTSSKTFLILKIHRAVFWQ